MHGGRTITRGLLVAVLVGLVAGCGGAAWAQSTEAKNHYREGMRQKRQGNVEQAVQELEAAVQADDQYLDAWWALANIYQQRRDTAKAQKAFQKVVDLAPQDQRAATARRYIEESGGAVRRGGLSAWVWIVLALVVAIVVLAFLVPRKKEEEGRKVAPITLGEESEGVDLADVAEAAGEPEPAAAGGDQMDTVLKLIESAPSKGPEFERLATLMGAAAIEDSASLGRMVDRIIPLLNSSDRDRKIKGYKLLSMFEGESSRIDEALESFDRGDITEAELEI